MPLAVEQHNEYHPYRCKRIDDAGWLVAYCDMPEAVSSNRQALPAAWFATDGSKHEGRVVCVNGGSDE